jgi:hypothetical protein
MTQDTRFTPDLLAVLGVSPGASTDPLGLWSAALAHAHLGDAGSVRPLRDLLDTAVPDDPVFTPLRLVHSQPASALPRVKAWAPEPKLVLVEFDHAVSLLGAASAQMDPHDDRSVWLDSRRGHAAVRLVSSFGQLLVGAFEGEVVIRGLTDVDDGPVAGSAHSRLPAAADLTGGYGLEPWVATALSAASASGSAYRELAALGLVARLWMPSPDQRAAAMMWVMQGGGPGPLALDWARSLPTADLSEVLAHSADQTRRMVETAAAVSEAIFRNQPDAADKLLRWLHDRDDLASIRCLLEGESAANLDRALRALDTAAQVHLTTWSAVPAFEDPRLMAVAWQEPDAWWGRFAPNGSPP